MVKVYGKTTEEVTTLLRAGKVTIDLVGIGNMGLPVAVAFASEGANVVGVRRKQDVVDQINRGESPLVGEPKIPALLKKVVTEGRFRATTDGVAAAKDADVIVLLIPLLVGYQGREDYSLIEHASKLVGKGLAKGDLVITSTTMPPGATEKIIKPILEKESQLVAGTDFGLAHSPERLMVGYVLQNLYNLPKVVGGIDKASLDAAVGVYKVFGEVVPTSSLVTAELVKVAEGTYRDVNIAYANFLAKICEPLGVNTWEVIATANHKMSQYYNIHRPGAGVGGHCIPVYPWFLINKAKELGVNGTLIRYARHINDSMPAHTVELAIRLLNRKGKALKDSTIGLLGIAFRGDVKETRFAPSLSILQQLQEYQTKKILAYDPYYTQKELQGYGFTPATFEKVMQADCVLLITPHQEFKDAHSKLLTIKDQLIDTTNIVPESYWKVGQIPPA
ncbi:MAG: nucleotide sugar dehydrogenase [Candidatus Thorarchaeota archaeon]